MIAIEIRHNGELKATCGAAVFQQLTAMLFVTKTDTSVPECEVECIGLCPRDNETEIVLRWVKKRVEIGDEVSFKVVQVESAQEPFDSQVIPKIGGQLG